jgi:NAD(P)-dependent dehydrogenase (short-subunit alcohol dehydrogenase family)
VLITGGSSGIGKGIALVLAEEGMHLAIASRNPDLDAIEEIRAKGVRCVRITADVSQEADVGRMVAEVIDKLGHLDCYVNNAAWAWHQPITKIDTDSWRKTLDTNLSSCVWACREVCRHMIARGSGSIVIISSTSRFTPSYCETAYRISKEGLHIYMQNLAIEMAPYGVRVNMVTPGHFKTRLTGDAPPAIEDKMRQIIPAHRFGEPKEVGYAVAFLLSDRLSGYTYGADLLVDGGLSISPLPLLSEQDVRRLNL